MKSFVFHPKKLWLPFVLGTMWIGAIRPAHTEGMQAPAAQGGSELDGPMKSAPSFREADKNGDHYVSREELKYYPMLLKHFDEVDAGKTGRLEEHEYGNLVMERSREKGRY